MPNGRSTPSGTDAPFPDDFHRNRSCSNEESLAITGLRNSIPLSVSVYEIACLVSVPHRELRPRRRFVSQLATQRSGCELERKSSGMSKLSHRCGSERYAACSDDAANTAVGNGCGMDTARVL